jgi:hypothetical protein
MAANPDLPASDHREAMRLAWISLHFPVGTIFLGTLLMLGVLSAASTMWGYGSGHLIP